MVFLPGETGVAIGGFLNTDVNYLRVAHGVRAGEPELRGLWTQKLVRVGGILARALRIAHCALRAGRAGGAAGGGGSRREKRAKGREEARRLFISR